MYIDLPSALSYLVDSLELAWSSHTDLTINGKQHRLSSQIEENILRIAQEVLQNAIPHGKAHQMHVELGYNEKIVILKIQDDGNGFELARDRRTGNLGITIMLERSAEIGARFNIRSEPGKGARVTFEVPIPEATLVAVSQ
jgi:signal transduction histidine kinase